MFGTFFASHGKYEKNEIKDSLCILTPEIESIQARQATVIKGMRIKRQRRSMYLIIEFIFFVTSDYNLSHGICFKYKPTLSILMLNIKKTYLDIVTFHLTKTIKP